MYDLWTTLATFTLLVLSAWLGRFIRPRMPETYRTCETIETMQLVIGMLITFAALVLSLLTALVKTSYDHAARDRHAYALRLTLLDNCLRDYGPGTASARADLARYTAAVITSTWPHEKPPFGTSYPNTASMPIVGASPVLAELMDHIGQQIRALDPTTWVAVNTADDCRASYRDVVQARLSVIEDAAASFSAPFFWILVFWLMAAFLALGLAAPRNRVAVLGILLCAMSLSSAVFVITDLSRPYRGLMAISSGDMRAALAQMTARGE
jgi:phosphotransferase system  glucose/maltose/N-acetylglucosamine-specific IIC component